MRKATPPVRQGRQRHDRPRERHSGFPTVGDLRARRRLVLADRLEDPLELGLSGLSRAPRVALGDARWHERPTARRHPRG